MIGNGCFCKSDSRRKRATRSYTDLHWLQETPILPLHSIRTRVRISTTYLPFTRLISLCRDKSGDRDVFNERPTRDEQSVAAASTQARSGPSPLANSATIHTTLGDIHMRLFPQQAPKAVENFVGHARSGYFEGIIFHRVIPKFMIQTGDPLGDGTGGMSIWGKEFEDEFSDDLKHDRWVSFPFFSSLWADLLSDRILSAWRMQVQQPMDPSFSSQQMRRPGWTRSTQSLAVCCLALKLCIQLRM